MKRRLFVMVALMSVLLMAIPFWGVVAQTLDRGGGVVVYTLLLDGGHIDGNFEDAVFLGQVGESANLPIPEREGFVFNGWRQLSVYGGDSSSYDYSPYGYVSYDSEGTADIVHRVYIAIWGVYTAVQQASEQDNLVALQPFGEVLPVPANDVFDVTFVLSGGYFGGSRNNVVRQVMSPAALDFADIPVVSPPALSTHEFIGWRVTGTNDVPVSPGALSALVAVNSNLSFSAVWNPEITQQPDTPPGGEPNVPPAPELVNLYFYLNGGTVTGVTGERVIVPFEITSPSALSLSPGALMIGLSNVPVPTPRDRNFEFHGWQVRGGSVDILTTAQVAAIEPDGSMIFDARWRELDIFIDVTFHPGDARVGASLNPLTPGALSVVQMRLDTAIASTDVPEVVLPANSFWIHAGWQLTSGNPSSAAGADGVVGHIVIENVEFTAQYHINVALDLLGNGEHIFRSGPEGATFGNIFGPELSPPQRAGYVFAGWNVSASGVATGTALTAEQVANMTVTAEAWTFVALWQTAPAATPTPTPGPETTPTPTPTPGPDATPAPTVPPVTPAPTDTPVLPTAPPITVTVRLNPGIGSLPASVSNVITGSFGFRLSWSTLPTPIAPHGYTFMGWFLHGVELRSDFSVVHDVTLYAHFRRVATGPTMFTLTFDAAGGVLAAGTNPVHSVADGMVLTTLPTATRTGYTFGGWRHGNYSVSLPLTVRGNMTLTAVWVRLGDTPTPMPTPPVIPVDHMLVVFNPQPGSFPVGENGVRTGRYGFVINSMTIPSRPGYRFVGWHVGGTPINFPLTVRRDMHIGAHWAPVAVAAPGADIPIRDNPQTGPVQVSLGVFGAAIMLGLAGYGMLQIKASKKAAAARYVSDEARFKRERQVGGFSQRRED